MLKKRPYIIVGIVMCCAVLLTANIIRNSSTETVDGAALRQKYPVITNSQYTFDTQEYCFEDRIKSAPNIAHIKITEPLPDYSIAIRDDEFGISNTMVFHQYKAAVISDMGKTNFSIDSDNTITICFASVFSASYPALSEGMELICSIEPAAGEHTGKYLLYDKSIYYVDSGMALAAYESDDSIAKNYCKKDKLVKQIKNIRNKR